MLNHVRTLRHVAQYSPLLDPRALPQEPPTLRQYLLSRPISQLSQVLSGEIKLSVPVYTVHGACEDVSVLEKFRSGEYKAHNLYIVDEHTSHSIETSNGVKFRLLGLGGALVMHKLFDNGSGRTTIAGGGGTTWTTLLQIGELIDTAARTFDESETRILITHASPAREGILSQLALSLKADFSISGGLHFRYGCSYNEFAVHPTYDYFRSKLIGSRQQFMDVWDVVKSEVQPVIANNPTQKLLVENALSVITKMPSATQLSDREKEKEEMQNLGFRNMWHLNLADVAYGTVVMDVNDGKIGIETKSEGFNFKYRRSNHSSSGTATTAPAGSRNNVAGSKIPSRKPVSAANGAASTLAHAKPTESATDLSDRLTSEEEKKDTEGSTKSPSSADDTKDESTPPTSGESPTAAPRRPGLWIARADESEEVLKSCFAETDQPNITGINIKIAQSGKKFAYVYFDTQENALAAMPRVATEKLGRVTLINDSVVNRSAGSGRAGSRASLSWGPRDGESSGPRIKGPRISGGSKTAARGGRSGRGRGGSILTSSGAPLSSANGGETTTASGGSESTNTPAPEAPVSSASTTSATPASSSV